MSLSIHHPLFYNWSTFMRRNHLTIEQIREFRGMDAASLGSIFYQKGVATAGKLFYQLLESFDIAHAVARAAWGYAKALENNDEYNAKEEWTNLERALHDFSPGNWKPHRSDLQFAKEYVETMFNDVFTRPQEQWEETMFTYAKQLQDLLEQVSTPLSPPDPQRVANGMQRNADSIYPCIKIGEVAHIERTDNLQPLCPASGVGGVRMLIPPTCADCLRLAGIFADA